MSAHRILLLAYLAFAVHLAVFVIAEFAVVGKLGPPIDDGWIYMAFARSLADGEGITYPGHDGPLCAVTGPIWSACLAFGFWLFGSSVVVAKACGATTGFLAVYSTYRLGRVATGDAKLGAIAALIVALTARFAWGSLSIMEVPFYATTVALGLALHLERREASLIRWLPALVVLSLSGWARPECFVFPVLAALHRRRLADLGVLIALLALYPAYHFTIYGHPLPTTFYAKASGAAPWSVFARDGALAAARAMLVQPLEQTLRFVAYLPTFLPVLALGVVPGVMRARRERSGVMFVVFTLLVFMLARGVLGVHQPWFQYGRYYAHVHVLFVVVALYGFDLSRVSRWPAWITLAVAGGFCAFAFYPSTALLFDWLTDVQVGTHAVAAFWITSIAGVALLAWGASSRPGRPPLLAVVPYLIAATAFGALRSGWNVRDTYELNVEMANRVAGHVAPDEVIACHDIGALGYLAQRRLLDLAGLGSPEVVFGPRREDGAIDVQSVLAKHRPRWLCLTPDMAARLFGASGLPPGLIGSRPVETVEFPENVTVLGSTYQLLELTWQD